VECPGAVGRCLPTGRGPRAAAGIRAEVRARRGVCFRDRAISFSDDCHAAGADERRVSGGRGVVEHVVIIFQENRSVDDLFNGFPGADTVTMGKTSNGGEVPLQPVPLEAPYDLDHSHISTTGVGGFVTEYNAGQMHGFDNERILPQVGFTPPPDAAYGYVPQSETKPYFALAKQFTFADRMFQTNQGPSFPAHQYIISGTSIPSLGSDMRAALSSLGSTCLRRGSKTHSAVCWYNSRSPRQG